MKSSATTYDFCNDDRAPCSLFKAGATTSCPVAVQRENYQRNAKHSTANAAHKVFPGRDHYTCGEAGWETVADFALEWSLDPQPGELD